MTTKDDLSLEEVANRLGKSTRWLHGRLAEDARRQPSEQRLQHHHYVGASPRWTEAAYIVLRDAIISEDTAKRRRPPKHGENPAAGKYMGRSGAAAVQAALAEVLNFPLGMTSEPRAKPKGGRGLR